MLLFSFIYFLIYKALKGNEVWRKKRKAVIKPPRFDLTFPLFHRFHT